jgi:hypothetical protein
VLYEAAGTVGEAGLAEGREVAERAHDTWRIPLEVVTVDPAQHEAWRAAARDAVERLLAP